MTKEILHLVMIVKHNITMESTNFLIYSHMLVKDMEL